MPPGGVVPAVGRSPFCRPTAASDVALAGADGASTPARLQHPRKSRARGRLTLAANVNGAVTLAAIAAWRQPVGVVIEHNRPIAVYATVPALSGLSSDVHSIRSSSEPSLRGFFAGSAALSAAPAILPNPHQVLWSGGIHAGTVRTTRWGFS